MPSAFACMALLGLLLPSPASAQTELRGEVTEVRGMRARVTLEGDLVPAVGDTARIGSEVTGVGEVPAEGTWRVTEVGTGWVWIDPAGQQPRPVPGYWARIWSASPTGARGDPDPGTGDETGETDGSTTARTPVERVRWREDFASRRFDETEDEYCRTRYRDGGLAVRNVRNQGNCYMHLPDLGRVVPPARITVTARQVDGGERAASGLLFGYRSGSEAGDYLVLLTTPDGRYRLSRYTGEWRNLMEYAPHPAIGPGENRLSVEVRERSVAYWVNGQYLGRHETDRDPGGTLALYTDEPGQEVVFDDLIIEALPGSEPPRTSYSPAGEVLIQDDYETPDPEFDDREGTYCDTDYREGWFVVETRPEASGCQWNLFSLGEVETRVRYVVRTWLLEGEPSWGYGLKFGNLRTDPLNDFVFLIAGDGSHKLAAHRDGEWVDLTDWENSGVARSGLGARNELAVEVRGREIIYYVNGRRLGSVTAHREPTGYLGYYLNDPGHRVAFDELRVERIGGGS